ncbi:MAG: hypothetical protein HC906_14785 [Bacteroidales bacterium]|nr:hypothetical protein [Bacteroidales bacterium]
MKKNDAYSHYWNKIDSLENLGLPRTALKLVDEVFTLAQKEKNQDQLVKALIYTMKFEYAFNPDHYKKQINRLEEFHKTAGKHVKPLIHSMLGEMYRQYFQNNRWKYYNRTQTKDFEPNDIDTWDLDKLLSTAREHYLTSISSSQIAKDIPLNNLYSEIIKTRPFQVKGVTLYDFMLSRALDFFTSEESSITRPVQQFRMDNPDLFLPAHEFISKTFESPDSTDHKYLSISIFQKLLRNHSRDDNPEAFVTNDLQRLHYLSQYSVVSQKETRYIRALENLFNKYRNNPFLKNTVGSYLAEAYVLRVDQSPKNPQYAQDYIKAMEICKEW